MIFQVQSFCCVVENEYYLCDHISKKHHLETLFSYLEDTTSIEGKSLDGALEGSSDGSVVGTIDGAGDTVGLLVGSGVGAGAVN